jgi:chromosome segregation ATPase
VHEAHAIIKQLREDVTIAEQDKSDYEAICQNMNDKLERVEKDAHQYPAQVNELEK